MILKERIVQYVNLREKRPKKIGRYSCSKLYDIISGKLKPEDYFKEEILSEESCINIDEGCLRESALEERLVALQIPHEYQPKKVLKIDEDIELVVVADFKFPTHILEVKSPKTMPNEIKPWNKHQLEAQFRAFNLPVYIGYIKERWENRYFKYEPDETRWEEINKALKSFHSKLCQLQPQK